MTTLPLAPSQPRWASWAGRPVWLSHLYALLGLLIACHGPPKLDPERDDVCAPDLILNNGAIYTFDALHPWAEAIAISDGQILAVGSDEDLARIRGRCARETIRLDLDGRMVLPGFQLDSASFWQAASPDVAASPIGNNDSRLDKTEDEWRLASRRAHRFGITGVFETREPLRPELGSFDYQDTERLIRARPLADKRAPPPILMRYRQYLSETSYELGFEAARRIHSENMMIEIHRDLLSRARDESLEADGDTFERAREMLDTAIRRNSFGEAPESGAGRALESVSLSPGKRADLCVIGSNLFRIPTWRIPEVRAEITIVDGRLVYVAEGVLLEDELGELSEAGLLAQR